ncbi:hypothetical protein HMPREF9413_5665 [Paenibacillus sp. HGF7]|nr:hypothetical protein HMPREF9413_5665 [Paenibacillus sp. HGF7]
MGYLFKIDYDNHSHSLLNSIFYLLSILSSGIAGYSRL